MLRGAARPTGAGGIESIARKHGEAREKERECERVVANLGGANCEGRDREENRRSRERRDEPLAPVHGGGGQPYHEDEAEHRESQEEHVTRVVAHQEPQTAEKLIQEWKMEIAEVTVRKKAAPRQPRRVGVHELDRKSVV